MGVHMKRHAKDANRPEEEEEAEGVEVKQDGALDGMDGMMMGGMGEQDEDGGFSLPPMHNPMPFHGFPDAEKVGFFLNAFHLEMDSKVFFVDDFFLSELIGSFLSFVTFPEFFRLVFQPSQWEKSRLRFHFLFYDSFFQLAEAIVHHQQVGHGSEFVFCPFEGCDAQFNRNDHAGRVAHAKSHAVRFLCLSSFFLYVCLFYFLLKHISSWFPFFHLLLIAGFWHSFVGF